MLPLLPLKRTPKAVCDACGKASWQLWDVGHGCSFCGRGRLMPTYLWD
jgi:hypothetical protein